MQSLSGFSKFLALAEKLSPSSRLGIVRQASNLLPETRVCGCSLLVGLTSGDAWHVVLVREALLCAIMEVTIHTDG